jgi:TrmH family RNA methyltransferase
LLVVVPEVELELPTDLSLALVIDRMRTPGNLGAILRTASAAGVQAVFTTEGTVDATNPKVVRGAMGAHFRLPMRRLDPESLVAQLHGLKVWITRAAEGLPHYLVDWRTPLALIIGGEAHGASARLQESATDITHIPMPGGGESLNASVAAGVFLFEIARQRATTPPA